jgi:tetratricopeptide (TPR) repeat protein
MPSSTSSWQAEKEKRERRLYMPRCVDRALEEALVDSDDGGRKLIYSVVGDGGLGKSTLLIGLRRTALARGCLCALNDHETASDVPEVLAHAAAQLREQEAPLKRFEERYKRYREQLHQLQSDPGAPVGVAGLVAGTVTRIGLSAIEEAPGGSIAVGAVDKQALAKQAAAWVDFVAAKVKRAEDRRLVLEPEAALGPTFLEELRVVARDRRTVLCFDTYEQTGAYLDKWIRALIEGKYGEVPMSVGIVVAGRKELSRNNWAPYEWLLQRLRLEPFTAEESRGYLTGAGIADEEVIRDYHESTGGMPLLLATLAAAPMMEGAAPRIGAEVAVARFLDAIEDGSDREAVIDAALVRVLNEETFAVARERQGAPSFGWLLQLPFVEEHQRGWAYHDVVRVHMLDLHRRLKPQRWTETHTQLYEYYESRESQLQYLSSGEALGFYAEYAYHLLCARPERLAETISDVIILARDNVELPYVCAEAIADAGRATNLPHLVRWGESLLKALRALNDEDWAVAIGFLDEAVKLDLRTEARGTVHMLLALGAFEGGALDIAAGEAARAAEALPEFSQHAEIIVASARYARGDMLASFELASRLLGDDDPVLRISGLVGSGQFERGLAEADALLVDDPDNDALLYSRAAALLRLGRAREGVRDIERAIELEGENPEYRLICSIIYVSVGRAADALVASDIAMTMRPGHPAYRSQHAEVLAALGRRSEALAEATPPIEEWPEVYSYWMIRGRIHLRFNDHRNAITDLQKAHELIEKNGSGLLHDQVEILIQLGASREEAGDRDGAATDLIRAVELARPSNDALLRTALIARSSFASREQRYADAARDEREALALTEARFGATHVQSVNARQSLGITLLLSGDAEGALVELQATIGYYEGQESHGLDLANGLYWLGRARSLVAPSGAKDLLERAADLYEQRASEDPYSLAATLEQLGSVYRKIGRTGAARTALERALRMRRSLTSDYDPNLWFVLHELGITLKEEDERPAAIAALEWELDVNDYTDPDNANVRETIDALVDLAADPAQTPPGAQLPPAPIALAHPRSALAHLRHRALASADLSPDLRRVAASMGEHADGWQELAASWTTIAGSAADVADAQPAIAAPEADSQQVIVAPKSAAQDAVAAYASREVALGAELMRALERFLVLQVLSNSVASVRAATASPENSTRTQEALLVDVLQEAVRLLFTVQVNIESASGASASPPELPGGGQYGEMTSLPAPSRLPARSP